MTMTNDDDDNFNVDDEDDNNDLPQPCLAFNFCFGSTFVFLKMDHPHHRMEFKRGAS